MISIINVGIENLEREKKRNMKNTNETFTGVYCQTCVEKLTALPKMFEGILSQTRDAKKL